MPKLLVVEDDPTLRETLALNLRAEGYDVVLAEDGEQGRTLAVEPEVILLDEPCSALDPVATLKIEDLMRELSEEYTIVIVTHNMQQAARVSDFTAMMLMDEGRAGRVIEFGEAQTLFTRPVDPRTEDYVEGRFG